MSLVLQMDQTQMQNQRVLDQANEEGFGNLMANRSRQRLLSSEEGGDAPEEESKEEEFNFFVDGYLDDQIQEIISIFRNDFKPPKNLWIEPNPSSAFNAPDYYAEIYASAID